MSNNRDLLSKFSIVKCMYSCVSYVASMIRALVRMGNDPRDECDDDIYRRVREEYLPNSIVEIVGNVEVRWLPKNFSQSKMGNDSSGSNACTLIAVLVALKCHGKDISLSSTSLDVYDSLFYIFCSSIIEGNRIHEDLQKSGDLDDMNLNVPEAIRACGDALGQLVEWKSLIYMMEMRESLFREMREKLLDFYEDPVSEKVSEVFVTLITENRTVLFIIQRNVNLVTLLDSHQHMPYGAFAAQSTLQHLEEMCVWYDSVLRSYYKLIADCYELSFLYVDSKPTWLTK